MYVIIKNICGSKSTKEYYTMPIKDAYDEPDLSFEEIMAILEEELAEYRDEYNPYKPLDFNDEDSCY